MFLQGPSLLQPLIGHLGDRRDLRALVVLTPAVTAVCMCLLGVAPGYGIIALLLAIAGTSSAVLHALAPVVTGRFSGRRLGFGMRQAFLACAVLGLLGMPFVLRLPTGPRVVDGGVG